MPAKNATHRDPRVDAYIENSAAFAQPVLRRLRELVHEACPQVEETIKWKMPTFVHAGGILCGMAAFKQHASFGFWKHALVVGDGVERDGFGSFGKVTSMKDLPAEKTLLAQIHRAMALNEQGVKAAPATRKTSTAKPPPQAPTDLLAALKKNKQAQATYAAFPPSAQREYNDWIASAKREQTRQSRLEQAIEWLAEGKRRNWKYESC